ncbi:MAG: helix-turn-helix domain-containing protein [Desulfobulbaceae bacterium]|nr:helix-turn-helix domain-containing protein [Desulfobulbaceae bacterium]
MMSSGEMIRCARKRVGWSIEKLAATVNLGKSTIFGYENDQSKKGLDPSTLVRIADTLNDLNILVHHCDNCPVRKQIFIKQFPELNNIRKDPAIISSRLRNEMEEASKALSRLADRFSDRDFTSSPDYQEVFEREMEQVIDVKRGIEILEFELVLSGLHSSRDLQNVYDRQQKKCVERGHHNPEEAPSE